MPPVRCMSTRSSRRWLQALRYYEHAGLIDKPDRSASGYRAYGQSVLDQLRFIRSAGPPGLAWERSRRDRLPRAGKRTVRSRPRAHRGRAADLDRRIAALRNLRDDLRALAQRGRTLSPEACSYDLVCHILNPAPT